MPGTRSALSSAPSALGGPLDFVPPCPMVVNAPGGFDPKLTVEDSALKRRGSGPKSSIENLALKGFGLKPDRNMSGMRQ